MSTTPAESRKENSLAPSGSSAIDVESVPLRQKRVPLLLRGQLREQHMGSTRRLSIAKGGEGVNDSARRLSVPKESISKSTRSTQAEADDQLDELLQGVAAAVSAPEHLRRSDKDALVLQAALALWIHRREARGFRLWKENTQQRVDLAALLAAGVNVHEEGRKLLLAAETKRRMLVSEHYESITAEAAAPSTRETLLAAKFTRAESDLLLAWARHTQPKTFRGVDDFTVCEVLRFLRFRQFQDGDAIFFEGDKGDVFYLVLEGNVGIYGASKQPQQVQAQANQPADKLKLKRKPSTRGKSTSRVHSAAIRPEKPDLNLLGQRMFTYRAGESFGETAMFTNDAVRTATAIASSSECEMGELPRQVYARTLKRFHQHFFRQAQRMNFAQRVPLFRDWPRARVADVAEALELRRFSFGGVLLSQGVSPLSHCFFVLSGAVSLTTHLEGDSQESEEGCAVWKKARHRSQLTIELHTIRAGETLALEALLEDADSTARVAYTAVGASADVEIYALERTEGREFVASATTNLMRQVRATCDDERARREERVEAARRALSEREAFNKRHRLELEKEALALGLTNQQQCQRQKQQELEELNDDRRSIDDARNGRLGLLRPFLPHLDATRLLEGVEDTGSSTAASCERLHLPVGRDAGRDLSLGVVAVPPKMLSALVKNFVFQDCDTLADDYAERLTLQLPPRCSLSPLLSSRMTSWSSCSSIAKPTTTQTHTARRRRVPATMVRLDERLARDLHMQQLRVEYDAKMHWDAGKKSFVLQQTVASDEKQQLPAHMLQLQATRTEGESSTPQSGQRTELHQQLQATQASARKLVDEHARMNSQRQARVGPSSSFVHFV
ncbi:hypothetical protein BBJ28_00024697 [Nothophytophthora sp. Chile5]|nr:hypothetical protein BBJ28_00024697 [Nothophytophthora sp. Chile5]